MKRLVLIRHAKSPINHAQEDVAREINEEGIRDASFIGSALLKEKVVPSLFIVSNAVRAMQSAACILESMGQSSIRKEPKLYNAHSTTILKIIQAAEDSMSVLGLVGHNPGFEDMATLLTDSQVSLKTSEVAIIDFDCKHWSQVALGKGRLVNFLHKPQ